MKKNATRYCAGPAYYRMYSNRRYCSKQTGSSSTKGNHHPSFLRFWNWAEEEETVDAAKICGGAENVVKTKPANIRRGLLGFITLGIYTPLEAPCIAHNNCASCPRYGQPLLYFSH